MPYQRAMYQTRSATTPVHIFWILNRSVMILCSVKSVSLSNMQKKCQWMVREMIDYNKLINIALIIHLVVIDGLRKTSLLGRLMAPSPLGDINKI